MPELSRVREVAAQIVADCDTDTARLFNGDITNIGPALGNMLAQIQALGRICEYLLSLREEEQATDDQR